MPTSADQPAAPSPSMFASSPRLPSADVLGIPLAVSDYDGVMDWMDAAIGAREPVCVTPAPVHLVMVAREDEATRRAVARCQAVPDGQPLVWALRALGHRAATRVYGPDLMAHYCRRAAATGVGMYFYGGRTPEALDLLISRLEERFPGLAVKGRHWPPFRPLSDDERRSVAAEINASGADVVWVGIGQPKQEQWMADMRERLEPPVLVGVGAAFDFHAGLVRQAPGWMQRAGLEWLFRFTQEPRRLWRRYVRYNPRFVAGFARQYVASRRAG
jgi:N-acetylglucosaminyldiphosphoundecaprenol N-acetyl-beta-D-mannosaminyltransferase